MSGDTSHLQDAVAKNTLIGQVMDGIYGGSSGIEGIIVVDSVHPIWHNAGVPIMTVDNIRSPVQCPHCFQNAPAEQDETLAVICIAIDVLALKIARGINHI